jgi:uncharacterized protein YjiS (DUF1127 family)
MFRFANKVTRALARRRTAHELSALPDHILKDIGVLRREIPFAVARQRDWDR